MFPGIQGKQVRDQIHSYDVVKAFEEYINAPRPGEVYNLGGGRENSALILECIKKIEVLIGTSINTCHTDNPRICDHICYISDLTKIKRYYPRWEITKSLDEIIKEMVETEIKCAPE